ncbi:branched-chain amino acid ABC transporter permease [Nakamurella sp. YIM 132087]|uniref:Branched-chain amino acid ABC transporter permease n=1 Tax=Nakamurella alba TaxID=2665158 RepID=A0A7K1FSZ1_9ACTN|nr:branched-chain amino acid ABC transporter permease [Nakamurella alba]MTD17272.1 branched-chain amino acid ABC transporter permease [Nakamurella alba]
MEQFVLVLVAGIASGAVYGLMGLGLVIIFRATDVVNFALASMATMALYIAWSATRAGWGTITAVIAAVIAAALIGIIVREVVIRPLGSGNLFSALVITMGASLIIDSLIHSFWGTQPTSFPALVEGQVSFGDSAIAVQSLLTIAVAAVAMGAVAFLFKRTTLGSVMRAVAESSDTAKTLGVNPQKVARIAWGLGMALAALAACLYAPRSGLSPTVLAAPLFRAFAGIFLGGLTSMYGAVIGGVTIGVLENLAATYGSASFRDTFVFAFTVLVLLIRPQGLFGAKTFERV